MKFTGQWHNPDYAGEGITSIEYPDGKVIAYFFTYHDDGSQMWLVCVGDRDDTTADLKAYRTEGGAMGDKVYLENVTEEEWGSVLLSEDNEGLLIDFFELGKPGYGYRLTPLYAPAEEPETIIKLEKRIPGKWIEVDYPVDGRMADPAQSEYRLTVVKGEVHITEAYAKGEFQPRLYGVRKGNTFRADDPPAEITFSMDDGWQQAHGSSEPGAWFGVHSKELGVLIDLRVEIQQ